MRGTRMASLAVLVVCLALANPAGVRAEEGGPGKTVQIGLVKTLFRDMPTSLISVISRPLRVLMEQSTGITGEMKLTGDHNLLAQQVKDGKIHLAVFHGFEFGWARQLNPDLRPLVIAVSHHKTLHAHLVVRKDSPYECCADLKGKVIALPSGSREHCHLYLERRCPGNGIEPKKFFARITKPDDHTDALDDLVEGKVDAVIVDRVGLDDYQKNKRARSERLRVLHQSETFPAAVIVYQTGQLSESVLKKFRDGLVSANTTERGRDLLRLCKITGFDEVPAEYETLLNEIVKAYPPPPAKK